MRTTIRISEYSIKLAIGGVSIRIDRDELFHSLKEIKAFVVTVFPESHQEDLKGSEFMEIFNKIEKYQPSIEKLLSCFKLEGSATSTITFNEDGTVDMESDAQKGSFDLKLYLQVLSDFSDMVQEESEPTKINTINIGRDWTAQKLQDVLFDNDIMEDPINQWLTIDINDHVSPNEKLTSDDVEQLNILSKNTEFVLESESVYERANRKGQSPIFHVEEIYATDQSMEDMANNVITFNERPSFSEVCFKMNVNNQRVMKHMEKHHGLHFNALQSLSSEHTRMLCDEFGFEANIQWPADHATE